MIKQEIVILFTSQIGMLTQKDGLLKMLLKWQGT